MVALFGVIYLATYLDTGCCWCYIFVWTFWCASWCFINLTVIFSAIAIIAKLLFGNQPYHQQYSEHGIPI